MDSLSKYIDIMIKYHAFTFGILYFVRIILSNKPILKGQGYAVASVTINLL